MKTAELRNKQLHELNSELISLLKTQFILKMQLATQQLSNTNQLRLIRKDIARVKTIITQKYNDHDR
ncbi:50S ribosomal protein L29 [Nitrosomonas sp. JL21]|uniref:50S ribosomal protein L29 n=1 Tax=Nitrosomonas sp. JL21 TaxID=153949 RepID=UPI00136A6BEF|nr:50S ribosomal protein L29 [Nitrosomonas sp. JL21]MBL8498294.1 50S ribosomal protein L29 [Nitrosomonas sp.]MXS77674.1 50S ribosomal protein L29 [Nitrosomonas sp. JL21]